MEVIVQLSRSEELKTHATIFEVEMRVGVKKNEYGWGLTPVRTEFIEHWYAYGSLKWAAA